MVTKIIAILLISVFIILTAVAIGAFIKLHRMGLLKTFLRGQYLLGLLSMLFLAAFIINSVALLKQTDWAVPAMRYTIYLWLVYLWLYGLYKILGMIALLYDEETKSVSQLMGRSKLFDELLERSILMSKQTGHPAPEDADTAHAASDPEWEALVDDEDWYREVLPEAVRRKVKRKFIGLLVHTAFFVIILLLL